MTSTYLKFESLALWMPTVLVAAVMHAICNSRAIATIYTTNPTYILVA